MNNITKFVAISTLALFVACANQSASQVAQDVANIAGGVAAAAQTLRDANLLTADQQVKLDDAVSALQAAALAVARATNNADQQNATKEAVVAFNAVTAALANDKNLPQNVTTVLTAAEVLLPTVEALVGLPVPSTATAVAMTPDEANAILATEAASVHP
jgi:hypothetical protein